ncbi:MAG: ABC transporter ATP-binding protein [Chloroflexota bacterium]
MIDPAAAAEVPDPMLEVEALTAGYDEASVLRDVSFRVPRGSGVSLLGPNGCGETSLLRSIGKLHPASAGVVRVAGRDVAETSQAELARVLATVSQVQRTTFPFSVLDVLLTGRLPYVAAFAAPGDADVQRCREVLDRFGIRHLESKAVTRLSGGERQLVMIARALAQEPRILLLDEPTTFLDLRNQVHVLDVVRRLVQEQDLTVLMTIHDPNQALAYSDHVVLLRRLGGLDGVDPALAERAGLRASLVAAGTPTEVLTPANVLEAYGARVDAIEHDGRRMLVTVP